MCTTWMQRPAEGTGFLWNWIVGGCELPWRCLEADPELTEVR